ncbi:zinc ABC transporter substrate-binding protein [Mycobacterium antarcticum]|uniref:metal ABC transporter solute-binding protein, Zn/Mn family n=1 Tax=Mycolicibacterium sp. TUM20983 TaxID=3023369 RepID=UPI0023979ABE|nr:zinc ABC transporter substrate-binding protein [Mycolicibacterium sp. TUM20983]GLP73581.1 zinc ABC transporter substrate-binding protein [Mycolicibacterium sp. TUM20983]
MKVAYLLGPTLLATVVAASSIAACSSDGDQGQTPSAGRPVVVTNFYPIQWLASALVGDDAEVISLTPEGTEPHDLALDADGQKKLGQGNVVLYLGADFQPDVQRAIGELGPSVTTEDLLTAPGLTLLAAGDLGKEALAGNKDPHVWLSPVQMQAMADAAATAITTGAPALAGKVAEALPALKAKLQGLDTSYRSGLVNCQSTDLVTSHAAFGYLADEYGLKQVPIVASLSPDAEPDPKTLQSIAEVARAGNVTTVFFEDALPNDLSKTVADEIGAQISLLSALEFDPRGSLGPDQDYVSVMTGNLDRIEKGLGCAGS